MPNPTYLHVVPDDDYELKWDLYRAKMAQAQSSALVVWAPVITLVLLGFENLPLHLRQDISSGVWNFCGIGGGYGYKILPEPLLARVKACDIASTSNGGIVACSIIPILRNHFKP